jgi:hypothetical protein
LKRRARSLVEGVEDDEEDDETTDSDLSQAIGNVSLELSDLMASSSSSPRTPPSSSSSWCKTSPAGSVLCSPAAPANNNGEQLTEKDAWLKEKESVETKIRELKLQLEELRMIRKKLKELKPVASEANSVS